ncbi:MAG: response regulator [Bacteroidetes bacterium]|nr:response regulator [Bacteroidota bacterium]
MNKQNIKIFLVDDDIVFLKSLEIEFNEHTKYEISTFPSGEECCKNLSQHPSIIILDYHLDGINEKSMNGIQTLDMIKSFNSNIQVVMLSSQDKIEVAVECMHHHAFDYVVKSETAFMRLQHIITNILYYQKMEIELNWYMSR